MWPMAFKAYLEEKIQFDMPTTQQANIRDILPNDEEAVGKPLKILALTSVANELKYLVQYKKGAQKLIKSTNQAHREIFTRKPQNG